MAAKGSRLSRTIQFFREADIEEATYVLARAEKIVGERTTQAAEHQERLAAPRRKRATPNYATQSEKIKAGLARKKAAVAAASSAPVSPASPLSAEQFDLGQ